MLTRNYQWSSSVLANLARLLLPAPATMVDYPFAPSDVAHYQRTVQAAPDVLDGQTWDDLLLTQYCATLAPGASILGQQELHRRLQAPADASRAAAAVRVQALVADPNARQRLQAACHGLRTVDREVSEVLFGAPLAPAPKWTPVLAWVPLAFLASIVLALVTGWLPLGGLALVLWLALMAIQVRFHEAAAQWQRVLDTIGHMLRAHVLLAGLDDEAAALLRTDAGAAGKLNRSLSHWPLWDMLGARDYGDWVWLRNIRHYFATRETVRRQLPLLRSSFERVAAIDADVTLARHLAQTPLYCWAQHGNDLGFDQAVHPLLAEPAPLSLKLGGGGGRQGAFISGQNGIGKSTLLRTVGLNLVTARAFGFCYAAAAVTPQLPVYSSMQTEDALASGESLYVAEVRRAGELLALAARAPAVFLIDEIFRGTNHLESVSAATAVLDTLATSGRVLVSSHNLILAPLLARRLAPLCVARVEGRLRVTPGVLKETNGITLLATIDASGALSTKARSVHARLGDYYRSYPGAVEAVLD